VLLTDFQFVFPRVLRLLRPIESTGARCPLGAQYMVLCRKVAKEKTESYSGIAAGRRT
jgi:hypothetical protein